VDEISRVWDEMSPSAWVRESLVVDGMLPTVDKMLHRYG
jgi:hypothetical protein